MSRYSSDSSDRAYIPITVNQLTAERPRERRPSGRPEPVANNFFLGVPEHGGRRRAASTGDSAQPINVIIGEDRVRNRSRHRRGSSSGSSRSHHSHRSHRSSIREDDLPWDVRRRLDIADQVEADERERRSRERRRERDRGRFRSDFEDEYEERRRKEERERRKIEDEIEEKKKEKEREKERIIEEAKRKEKDKKKEEQKMKDKWAEEEEDKKRKKKEEQKIQDQIVEERMKQKFRSAGYSEAHIEDILHRKRSRTKGDMEWAIDLSRPTFIKVHRKYLSPDTLDKYYLPWEWDKHNSEYIIIKKYIDNDFQDELFRHTKMLKEKKTITSGYVKDTEVTTKLRPRENSTDQMYLVRSKSRSRGGSGSGTNRKSWMFT